MLKNDIRTSYSSISDSVKEYVRSLILLGLDDPSKQIRSYAGNVITEIVRQGGIMGWPTVLNSLMSIAGNESQTASATSQEGAMSALLKICEDNPEAMESEYEGQRPLEYILPKLLEFTTSQNAKIRALSLGIIDIFIPEKSQPVMIMLDTILMQLFHLTNDASEDVRKYVCRTIIHVADVKPEAIVPHMAGLVDYMVTQQRNVNDPELALEAAEFWLCVAEDKNLRTELGPHLPKIVPVLLESMVFGEEEILRQQALDEDAEEDDRPEDIKPVFATSRVARMTAATTTSSASTSQGAVNGDGSSTAVDKASQPGAAQSDVDQLSEGEIEAEDEDDEDGFGLDDPEDVWSLRKCSAAALDVLASVFKGAVFEVTLPYLTENLNHKEWPNREAAVLALGAIADGCMEVVQPHLPVLTSYLISLLDDKEPVVRMITCWTLGRYSSWAAQLEPEGKQQFLEPIMDGILKRMLDGNKRVQEAAASSFANLEEKATTALKQYSGVIVRQFVQCFARYKDRNMFILYDCVQTLAEHVGPDLAVPETSGALMKALIDRWNKVADDSREIFPLLECLSYVATALGDSFGPYAPMIASRCISIIQRYIQEAWAEPNGSDERPEKDFLVTSLDLLSSIIQALDDKKSSELVRTSQPNFFELLGVCMGNADNEVRQSAYALLGDCAIYVFADLQPCIPSLVEILIRELDISRVTSDSHQTVHSVINNACWSIGEISMRQLAGMAPYVERLMSSLVTIVFSDKVSDSITENAAIALSRLGIGNAQALAPHLATFAPPVLRALSHVEWTDEKGHALLGFMNIVLCNPLAMEQCLLDLFSEMAGAPSVFLSSLGPAGPFPAFREVSGAFNAPSATAILSSDCYGDPVIRLLTNALFH